MEKTLEEFAALIKERLEPLYGGVYTFRLQDVINNNQVIRKGLYIEENRKKMARIICLEPYFERYQDGETAEALASVIFERFPMGRLDDDILEQLADFNAVKNMITFSLVNARRNKRLLEEIPYAEVMDLALIFHIDIAGMEKCRTKIMIDRERLNLWGVRLEKLKELAAENTPRLNPASLRTKEEVMKQLLGEYAESGPGRDFLDEMRSAPSASPLHVLSNHDGMDGAAAMLYDGVLKKFADGMGTDLIVIPTSVHEVMVLPHDDGADIPGLQRMLRHMNRKGTPPEDVLSDYIYSYERQGNSLTIAGEKPGGKFFLGQTRSGGNAD